LEASNLHQLWGDFLTCRLVAHDIRQPQIVWSPKDHRFAGYVAMHLPDAWGYMAFGPPMGGALANGETPKDPTWPSRLAATHIYYAQSAFREDNGVYASNVDQLSDLIDREIIEPFGIMIDLHDDGGYIVEVSGSPDGTVVYITNERFIRLGVIGTTKSS
jgi:hypothetical protein